MFSIDQYAYSSRLRSTHPGEKFAFAFLTLVISLVFSSPITSLAIVFLMAGVVVFYAGIPWRFYVKLMLLPLSFLLIGVATIAISVSRNPGSAVHGIVVWGLTVGVAAKDLSVAASLFCRSLGAVSCLYFLSLTTPVIEIISVLKKLRVPALFIELMSLIYRFIFVVMETAERIYTSQSSRCGYASLKNSYNSLGQLASNLLLRSYHRSQALFTALTARCYTGDLKVIERQYAVSRKNILIIALVDLVLAVLALYTGGGLFGRVYP